MGTTGYGKPFRLPNFAILLRIIWILIMVDPVIGGKVPGVKWSSIQVWEDSRKPSVWDNVKSYKFFRAYALGTLSDAGYFDHLLGDLNGDPLRVISGVGLATGVILTLVVSRVRRQLDAGANRPRTRTTPRRNSENDIDNADNDDTEETVMTLEEVKHLSTQMILRMLRDGPIRRLFLKMTDDNPLTVFMTMDQRIIPDTPEDKQEAEIAYVTVGWQVDSSFWTNFGDLEELADTLGDLGVRKVTYRELYRKMKNMILAVLPQMRVHFDYLESAGQPAHGTGNITQAKYFEIGNILQARYREYMRTPEAATGKVSRKAFAARER